jgi:dTDP-4-amino-4,6-dideoxygalactose transaminase
MSAINSIADRHGLVVVEDAAHAVGSRFAGRSAGAWGSLACYSFHETKNITCGQGGALCINDPSYLTRAEIIRDKGTNRAQYFRGQTDKYTWVDIGSSFVMGELAASYLAAQLEYVDELTEKRRKLYDRYYQSMVPWADEMGFSLPVTPNECQSNYHIFYLVMETSEDRDELLGHLNQQDIWAVFHYVPLHSSPLGKSLGYREVDVPVAESIASRLIRFPMYNELDDETQNRVIEHVHEFFRTRVTRRSHVNQVSAPSLMKRRSE